MVTIPVYTPRNGLATGSAPRINVDTTGANAVAGFGRSVQGLGQSLIDEQARNDAKAAAEADRFQQTQDASWFSKTRAETAVRWQQKQVELQQAAGADNPDYTATLASEWAKYNAEIMASAPTQNAATIWQQWAPEFEGKLLGNGQTFAQAGILAKRENDLNAALNAHSLRVAADPDAFDEVLADAMDDLAGASMWLTPEQEVETRTNVEKQLKLVRAGTLAKLDPVRFKAEAGFDQKPQADLAAGTVRSADIPSTGAQLLNVIAGVESPDYNVLNGGERFDSFADHPRRKGANGTSTAAGRYQFVKATWDRAAKALGLTDFSPESQDKAAWWLAQQDYKARTGRDLSAELAEGTPEALKRVRAGLSATWEGLHKSSDGKFLAAFGKAGDGLPTFADNPMFAGLTPDEVFSLNSQADASLRDQRMQMRAGIELAVQNAPAAIQSTGSYTGKLPSEQDFIQAYGADDGPQRARQFAAAVETATLVNDMQTQSSEEIRATVAAAVPTDSGDGAALSVARFDALQKAADAALKAREADPAGYVSAAFPSVGRAWNGTQPGGPGYEGAVSASVAAQREIGIAPDRIAPLPKSTAAALAEMFNDPNKTEQERVSALTSAVFAVSDPSAQKAIFDQLVKAGVPEYVTGAMRAVERGDDGAARRLMQAAMLDPDKLPGKVPETDANIRAQVQADLMDDGGIGDAYYGLSDGAIENYAKAQTDSTLLLRAVQMRMLQGEDLSTAVENAGKDLYGNMKIVTGSAGVNTKILVPADTDESETVAGLEALLPRVGQALEAQTAPAIAEAPAADGTKAIMEAAVRNRIADALSEGYFVSAPGGFAYLDVYTGMPIPGPDGKPLVFTPEEVSAAAKAPQTRDPVNLDPEARFLEERARALGGTTPSVGTIARTPPMPEPAPADDAAVEPATEAPAVDVTPDAEARFMEERANALGGTTPRVGTGRPGGPITGGRF